jgi:hypothetical protein
MPQRRPKFGKHREGQLERLPEKLQRKRERRVSSRIRRMPNWIRIALVLIVVIVIIGGVILVLPPSVQQPLGPTKGNVYFVQTDQFYCNVYYNGTPGGKLAVDYMKTRFGVGTYNGTQPLHVSILDTFNENRNITFDEPFVWDYYGNCYKISPTIAPRSISFNVGGISPALVNQTPIIPVDGSRTDFGNCYWSLFFGYRIDSANDSLLAHEDLSDLFALNFTIQNVTLLYGVETPVKCHMTLFPPTGGIQYCDGLAYIQFPTTVYNGTHLLANITLATVNQIGTTKEGTYTSNQSLITMRAPFTFLANNSWGFDFDLNVTSYASSPFCLLNLSAPECRFFLRAGFRNYPAPVFDQPMHFPKASVTINTPYQKLRVVNYTEVFLRLPQVWLNAVHVGNSTPVFVPLVVQPGSTAHQRMSYSGFENSPKMRSFQTARLFAQSSQLVMLAAVTPVLERLRRTPLI